MPEKQFSLKSALKNVIGGVMVGGAIGLAAALRELTRSRNERDGAPATEEAEAPDAAEELGGEVAGGEVGRPALAPQARPGWNLVEREPLPRPTYWPAALAFGIVLLAWGIVTTWIIAGVGAIVLAVALAGWIGELRHGH
jgi:hypothetical protein